MSLLRILSWIAFAGTAGITAWQLLRPIDPLHPPTVDGYTALGVALCVLWIGLTLAADDEDDPNRTAAP